MTGAPQFFVEQGRRESSNGRTAQTDFAVLIESGVAPVISWAGQTANSVCVVDARWEAAIHARWAVRARSPAGLTSPIVYGSTPDNGSSDADDVRPLETGRTYLVVVHRLDGLFGAQYFTV